MILILAAFLCRIENSLNEKVVEFARSHVGEQVGNGQCTALAVEALRHSGARRRGGRQGVWGDLVESLRDVQPGDILQFENVLFLSTRLQEDGTPFMRTRLLPHHTAIVIRVRKRGIRPILVILHQNVDGSPIVQEWTIDMKEKRRGSVTAYRPVPERPERD